MAKMYSVTVRNRAAGVALAVGVVGVGIVLVTIGFALLAGLALAGGVLGTGYAIYHRLRGGRPSLSRVDSRIVHGLDPSGEIRPVEPPRIRRIEPGPDDASG